MDIVKAGGTANNRVPGFSGCASVVACGIAAALLGLSASAAAQGTGNQRGAWQYELTPYLWAAGMKGNVRGGPLPNINVDMSFSDIWDALDAGLMGSFEARNGRWGILFDGVYMKLSAGATATRTGPGPVGAALSANANATMAQGVYALAAAYRVAEGATTADVIGGLRYTRIEVNADIHASLFAATGYAARSASKDWVDPYVGLRVQQPISGRWRLDAYGDLGGFGAGSDLSYQASIGAGYDFSKTVSGRFGYRYFYVDYDKPGFLWDMTNSGLYAGVAVRF